MTSPPMSTSSSTTRSTATTSTRATSEPVSIGSATVSAGDVAHQGPTVGYRIEEGEHSLAYLPDHEPSLGIELDDQPPTWISGYSVAHGVDVLFHDAQYGDHEYPDHVGWGHSAIGHVVEFVRKTDVGTLVLFHHDPNHTDSDLEALLADARRRLGGDPDRICLASEGMTVVCDRDAVVVGPAAGVATR